MMKTFAYRNQVLFFVLGLIATYSLTLLSAARIGYFVDETQSVTAGFNFLTKGYYYAGLGSESDLQGFHPAMSIGIMTSWVPGLAWLIWGTLFSTRVASIAYCFSLFWILGTLAGGQLKLSTRETHIFTLISWLILIRFVPYALIGMTQSLGEMSGAILLGIGLLLLARDRHFMGGAILGLSVWHAKFIYAPFALLAIFLWPPMSGKSALTRMTGFLAPLGVWLTLILVRSGPEALHYWFWTRLSFIQTGHSGLSGTPRIIGLAARLHELEWVTYGPEWKIMILFFPSAAIGLLIFQAVRRGRSSYSRDSFGPLQLSMSLVMLSYLVWWFFWHDLMWVRHIEPALLIGCGSVLWFAIHTLGTSARSYGKWMLSAMVAYLLIHQAGLQPLKWVSSFGPAAKTEYAWTCHSDSAPREVPTQISSCMH